MIRRFTVLALVTLGAVAATACKKKEAGPPGAAGGGKPGAGRGPMAFPVEVQTVGVQDVEYSVRAVGSVEAFETVQITARVAGAIEKVSFTEGQVVKKGDLLVEIEPHRFTLAVKAAEASLEKARASSSDARASLARRESIVEANPGLIPGEEVESFRTRARTAAAEESAAKVALEQAQLALRDAYVRAPVDGVLQSRTVQTGQYVQPGTVLATLLRRDPLLVRFRVPEAEAARLREGQLARFVVRDTGEAWKAKLTHIAGAAEGATRMVAVTGAVQGDELDALRPGAFAEITVPVGSSGEAPVIPQTAIRPSERGFLAFVIDGTTAKERVLELGLRTEAGQVEVKRGLQAGETLVVRGAEALRDGATVRIVQREEKPVKTGGAELAPGQGSK